MVSAFQSLSGELPTLRIGAAKPEMGSTADVKVITATAATKFIRLNERWRVRLDDPLQSILERRRGRPNQKSTGWQGRSYCAQRTALLRDIRDNCGVVDTTVLRLVEALPERFPYRRRR